MDYEARGGESSGAGASWSDLPGGPSAAACPAARSEVTAGPASAAAGYHFSFEWDTGIVEPAATADE